MGRKSLTIKKISDFKLRRTTFEKRKQGLLKKAMELSILCGNEVLLSFLENSGKCVIYHSTGEYYKYSCKYMLNEEISHHIITDIDYDSFTNFSEGIKDNYISNLSTHLKEVSDESSRKLIDRSHLLNKRTNDSDNAGIRSEIKLLFTKQSQETKSTTFLTEVDGLHSETSMLEQKDESIIKENNMTCSKFHNLD